LIRTVGVSEEQQTLEVSGCLQMSDPGRLWRFPGLERLENKDRAIFIANKDKKSGRKSRQRLGLLRGCGSRGEIETLTSFPTSWTEIETSGLRIWFLPT
jgi:hypothetical protein